jgi:hypothetical protein
MELKCVMVIDEELPMGIIANTAAILGVTMGKQMPETVGSNVIDKTGNVHLGIVNLPIPILKGQANLLKELREKLYQAEFAGMTVVDFSDIAQGCKAYDEFIDKIAEVQEKELQYLGLAICGNKKKVNKLTGNMPLLR